MTFYKNYGRSPGIFLLLILLTFFSSCSARIDAVFSEGVTAELTVRTSLGPRTIALLNSMRSFMGEESETPLLDGPSISGSLVAISGIGAVHLNNTSPSALEGRISLSNVSNILADSNINSPFISYIQGSGYSSMVIILDRETAPELISRLSPEIVEYLSALFAPLVLGDTSTRQEYLGLLASFYGRPLADEIEAARIFVRIEFPRQISAVQGGSFTGRHAEFNIPLLDILVLEQPLYYEVRVNN